MLFSSSPKALKDRHLVIPTVSSDSRNLDRSKMQWINYSSQSQPDIHLNAFLNNYLGSLTIPLGNQKDFSESHQESAWLGMYLLGGDWQKRGWTTDWEPIIEKKKKTWANRVNQQLHNTLKKADRRECLAGIQKGKSYEVSEPWGWTGRKIGQMERVANEDQNPTAQMQS